MIRSHSNPTIKDVTRLRKSSYRRETSRFLIDGKEELSLAIEHGVSIQQVFYSAESVRDCDSFVHSENAGEWIEVVPSVLEKISYGQRQGDFVAVAETPKFGIEGLSLSSSSLILVLDQTEKPGNLGACIRTASACNVDAVILTDPICEPLNPNAIRSSRGLIFRIPLAVCSPEQLCTACTELGLNILCARTDGNTDLWKQNFREGSAIVFGNEAEGLAESWTKFATFRIPMASSIDSLNLSNSAAVTLYEAIRQRSQ